MKEEEDQKFYVKGSGTSGCLLTGSLEDQLEFIPMKLPTTVSDISLAGLYAVAVPKISEGELLAWGTLEEEISHQPIQVLWTVPSFKAKIQTVSCGWNHTLIKTKGGLFGFGENKFGQLGTLCEKKFIKKISKVWPNDAQQLGGHIGVISAGFRQSFWSANDVLFGCGESKNYELGIADKKGLQEPKPLPFQNPEDQSTNSFTSIQCGKKFSVLLTKEGQLLGMGCNDHGCLFHPSEVKYIPKITHLLKGKKIRDVACGWTHCILLDEDGRIRTEGRNNFGQLGRKIEKGEQFVDIGEPCRSISSGTQFNFAVGNSGKLYGWGWNQHMNIINSSSQSVQKPTEVPAGGMSSISKCITYPAITIILGT